MRNTDATEIFNDFSSEPLIIIDNNLSFYEAHLVYNNKRYLYSDIKALNFSRNIATMNFLPYMNETGLYIIFDNDEMAFRNSNDELTRGQTSKLIEQAYYFLQKETFKIRLNKILNILDMEGVVTFGTPEVRLYRDGTIENKGGRRLNIDKSANSLYIGFGVTNSSFTDPSVIRISDKPRPFFDFEIFESKKTITFNVYENIDVIKSIIKYFVER